MAGLSFVSTAAIGQMASFLTGIQGLNYSLTIVYAVISSLSLLLYEGRRWRFFAQYVIFDFLIIPTYLGGPPFSVLTKIPVIPTAFIVDFLFNTVYKTSKSRGKLMLWGISGALLFYLLQPSFSLLLRYLFYTPQAQFHCL